MCFSRVQKWSVAKTVVKHHVSFTTFLDSVWKVSIKNRQVKNSQTAWDEKYISLIRSATKRWCARYKHEKYRFRNMSVFWLVIYMRMAYESVTTKSGYPSLLTYKLFILETNTCSLLPYLRMQWSVIFAVAICCSGLRLRVGYFTYFKVTHVFL